MSNSEIFSQPASNGHSRDAHLIRAYPLFISIMFLIFTPFAVMYTEEWGFFENLRQILTSPCPLVTDYFAVGGLGSTLFNAAVCGLFANLVIYVFRAKLNATILAGYMLIDRKSVV